MISKSSPSTHVEPKYNCMDEPVHIRVRPDLYLGEIGLVTETMTVYDLDRNTLVRRDVTFSQGIVSIFDELFMNAVDNMHRTPPVKNIKINITDDTIDIYNDGYSISLGQTEVNGKMMYNPEMLFTQFRSGSNFGEEKVTGGKNGIGCKAATMFSSVTRLEIVYEGQKYTQLIRYKDVLRREVSPPIIVPTSEPNSVRVILRIDFDELSGKLGADHITSDTKHMLYRRVYDLTHLNINFTLNGCVLPKLTWTAFVNSFGYAENLTIYEHPGWKIAFGLSREKHNESYVNNIYTIDNGTHVNYIRKQLTDEILKAFPEIKSITPTQINSRLTVFVYCIIHDPTFNSQIKEKLTLAVSNFVPKCTIPVRFIKAFIDVSDIVNLLMSRPTRRKRRGIVVVEGAQDANNASRCDGSCILCICEGLSARTVCQTGIAAIRGADTYGTYPLGGKVLNVRSASTKTYLANKVLTELKLLIGLEDGVEYTSTRGLRYGKILCVKDADADGASIMGLVINFFEVKFKSLLRIPGFFNEFITPMIIISRPMTRSESTTGGRKRGTETYMEFYNETGYDEYAHEHTIPASHDVTYIKGLGAIKTTDICRYFSQYSEHSIEFRFTEESWRRLELAFAPSKHWTDKRKAWIAREEGAGEVVFTREPGTPMLCEHFIDADLMNYSYSACVRAIPSIIDGLKPTQRKILYVLFQRGASAYRMQKVYIVGGDVSHKACYHHGDASMNGTITAMLQDYPGSNNLPLLSYEGSPGTRQSSGADAAAARYLACGLSHISRLIFPPEDDCLLEHTFVDGMKAEYKYFVPIIPMVLINGVKGIGTGWSTEIPAFHPLGIIKFVKNILRGRPRDNVPVFYRGYTGEITETEKGWSFGSHITITGNEVHITEIPVGIAIEKIDIIVGKILNGTIVIEGFKIININNQRGTNNVDLRLTFETPVSEEDVIKYLELSRTIYNTNMVLFNPNGIITRYPNINNIIFTWYRVRHSYYVERRRRMIEAAREKIIFADAEARFIKAIIDEDIDIRNIKILTLMTWLGDNGYPKKNDSWDYLTNIPFRKLTAEEYAKILENISRLKAELASLERSNVIDAWLGELKRLKQYIIENKMV